MDRIFLCILVGFFVSLVLSPLVIKFMKRLKANQIIYEYVDMHAQKANTPTMGGIIFILGAIIASFCCFRGSNKLAIICIVCFLCFGIIGFLDDFLKIHHKQNMGLKPYQKIIGQVAISVIIAVFAYQNSNIGSSVYLPFSQTLVDLGWFYVPFCVFVFLAVSNGVNLTDGLDGLAGGVSLAYLFGFVFVEFLILKFLPNFDSTVLAEQQNILILCGGTMGALLCYLLFNSFPAKIFMGDTGSLALGGLIASVAICTKQILLIPILGIMFVVSCVSVVLQVCHYKLTKKRIFLMAPYHHHLEKKGIHESKIVVIYIVITIVISVASILTTLLINH
jgi:phospho-N-acetylmuramoyl-pentapeptide-transferase